MRKFLILGGIVAAILILILLGRGGGDNGIMVDTAAVKRQTVHSSILASGQMAYREDVELRSEVIGQVVEVLVKEGEHVNKDQVVLRLDPKTFKAEVDSQEANVRRQEIAIERQKLTIANLEQQWQRKKQLHKEGLLDESSFEIATNELAISRLDLKTQQQALSQAQAQLNQARERLSKTVIRSPMDGMVTGLFVEVGETVISGTTNIAGSTLLTIGDPAAILAKVQVDEADIANVTLQQEAKVYAAAYPEKAITGQVESIATTARTVEGRQGLSFEIEILLTEKVEDMLLRPGMSARAEIFTATSGDTLSVPLQAVQYPDNDRPARENGEPSPADAPSPYVFIFEDGKAVKHEVVLGISDDSQQEILDGLAAGDQVITGPIATLRHLQDGAAVTRNDKAPAGADKSDSIVSVEVN